MRRPGGGRCFSPWAANADDMADAFVTGGSGFVGRRLVERLVDRGDDVWALARSDASAQVVREAGATPVRGDLSSVDAMRQGMADARWVVHAAAKVDDWGPHAAFERVNVDGTRNVCRAARDAGVDRLVYVSSSSVLNDGEPVVRADETTPIGDPATMYGRTKARAERLVRDADGEDLTTVAVRPRFVWGPGDTSLLPEFTERMAAGRFVWFDGGRFRTSTCHVDNAVECLLLAAEDGDDGAVYHATDGEPVEFRSFVRDLVGTRGVEPDAPSVPRWLAEPVAVGSEWAWRRLPLPGTPPLTRTALYVFGQEVTLDDERTRAELGYEAPVSRAEGLAAMREPRARNR